MNGVTPEHLMTTGYVLMAIFAGVITIDKAIDIFRKWNSPATDVMKRLAADQKRLDEQEAEIKSLQKGQQALCAGLLALLDHELHNGNSDQMQKARDDIMSYLQDQLTK